MSERERQRRLFLENRLQELNAKYGPVEHSPPQSADTGPSWGPVGSLVRSTLDPASYAHLLALHADMLAIERARKASLDVDSAVLQPGPGGALGEARPAA
jgi:hypothetical protein